MTAPTSPSNDYPYLRAWDRIMGSSVYWCEKSIAHARRDGAPHNAIYRNLDGHWVTFDEVERPDTIDIINKLVGESAP